MKKIIIALICALLITFAGAAFAEGTQYICVVTKGEWVWVRDNPDKDAAQIDKIRYGFELEVSEIVNNYAHITYIGHGGDTYSGWVDAYYIEQPISEETWVVTSDGPLNKRETPDGRFMTKIKSGSRISVLGWRLGKDGSLWAKVYHGGYVKACYLAKAD